MGLRLFPWVSISFSFNGTNNFHFADTAGFDASVKEIHIHIKTAFKGCGTAQTL